MWREVGYGRESALCRQAESDLRVALCLLGGRHEVCHAIHYFQMASEKIGRAIRISGGQYGASAKTHVAIVKALRLIMSHPKSAAVLMRGDSPRLKGWIEQVLPLARSIERVAPAVAGNGENAEYPWMLSDGSWTPPSDHDFRTISSLLRSSQGNRYVDLLKSLTTRFHELF